MMVGSSILGASLSAGTLQNAQQLSSSVDSGQKAAMLGEIQSMIGELNIPLIVGGFIFYFLSGYLFYASLFAAVGSAVNEDPQDAQSMMFPITIPIIFSFIIMTSTVSNPTGNMAVWCSMIPFTSPIIMMARLPFGVPGTVPYWQLGLSVVSMILGIALVMWICARIYRTGILMYGKKPSWKEMLKWVFVK
jgi:ABC-2 type transport system permease protein